MQPTYRNVNIVNYCYDWIRSLQKQEAVVFLYNFHELACQIFNIVKVPFSFCCQVEYRWTLRCGCWWFTRRLSVKMWLTHKGHKVQVVPDASWRRYWACLRGGVLELYRDQISAENRNQRQSSIGRLKTGVSLR